MRCRGQQQQQSMSSQRCRCLKPWILGNGQWLFVSFAFLFVCHPVLSVTHIQSFRIFNLFSVCFLQDIREGATYKVKFWLRSTASLSLSVSFTSADGSQTLAQETVESVSTPHFETSNSINKVK